MTRLDALRACCCARAVVAGAGQVRLGTPADGQALGRARALLAALARGKPGHSRIVRRARTAVDMLRQAHEADKARASRIARRAERAATAMLSEVS